MQKVLKSLKEAVSTGGDLVSVLMLSSSAVLSSISRHGSVLMD